MIATIATDMGTRNLISALQAGVTVRKPRHFRRRGEPTRR